MSATATRRPVERHERVAQAPAPSVSDRAPDAGAPAGMPMFLSATAQPGTAIVERVGEGPEERESPRDPLPATRVAVADVTPTIESSDAGAATAVAAAADHDQRLARSADRLNQFGSTTKPTKAGARDAEQEKGDGAKAQEATKPASKRASTSIFGDATPEGQAKDEDAEPAPDGAAEPEAGAAAPVDGVVSRLDGVGATLGGLRAAPVQFLGSERADEHERSLQTQSEGTATGFVTRAAGYVDGLLAVGRDAPTQIAARRDTAKAALETGIAQQHDAVTVHFNALRTRARVAAAAARSRIQAQFNAAAPVMSAATAGATARIGTAHTKSIQTLDRQQNTQRTNVDQRYADGDKQYRATGPKVGQEAVTRGEQRATAWLGQRNGESSLLDGPIHDNRLEARADAARKVAAAYDGGLKDEANKQADEGAKGKPRDLSTIGEAVQQALATLTDLHEQSRTGLTTGDTQAIAAITSTRDTALRSVANALASTLASLATAEATAHRVVADTGRRQLAALDQDASAAMGAITGGVGDAAQGLTDALLAFREQASGSAVPDPAALDGLLGESEGAFATQAADATAKLGEALARSMDGLDHAGGMAIQGLTELVQMSQTEGTTHGDAHAEAVLSIAAGAARSIVQLRTAHVTSVEATERAALGGFDAVGAGIDRFFEATTTNLATNFTKASQGLETGLRDTAQKKLDPDVDTEAQKAADAVQPRWKKIAKILLVVAVIIVVALVIGPAVIGAVGAAAGALGASAAVAGAVGTIVGGAIVGAGAGAVIQIGSNLIDGERSLGGIFKGVGKAAAIGAIGGAFGGAGAVLGKAASGLSVFGSALTQTAVKFGVGFAADVAGGIAGNVAVGDPVTLEGVLIGAGIGLGVGLASSGLGRLGRFGQAVEGLQSRSAAWGEGLGGRAGGAVADSIGIRPSVSEPVPSGSGAPRDDFAPREEPGATQQPDFAPETKPTFDPEPAAPSKPVEDVRPQSAPEAAAPPKSEPTSAPQSEAPAKPADNAVSKPVEEPNGKPSNDAAAKPVEEPATTPLDDAATKPAEEPATKPSDEAATKPVEEAPAKPSDDEASTPVEESAPKAVEEPAPKAAEEPAPKAAEEQAPKKSNEELQEEFDANAQRRDALQKDIDTVKKQIDAKEAEANKLANEAAGKRKGDPAQGSKPDPARKKLFNKAKRAQAEADKLKATLEQPRAELEGLRKRSQAIDEELHPEKYPKTTKEKGDIGEVKGHAHMEAEGYQLAGSSKKPSGVANAKGQDQGIDGVYEHPNPGPGQPKYVVVESKYVGDPKGKPSYGKSSAGAQDDPKWVDANLDQAVGQQKADAIRAAGYEYRELRYDPKSDTVIPTKIADVPPIKGKP